MKRNYFQNVDHDKCAIYRLPVKPLTSRRAYSPHLLYHYTIVILRGKHFLELIKTNLKINKVETPLIVQAN